MSSSKKIDCVNNGRRKTKYILFYSILDLEKDFAAGVYLS